MTRKTIRTMEELACEIDVSRPTLSRYFHDPSSVRGNTRAKIEARLAAVDYVPNFFARNLNRKRTRLIGVVVPHLNDIFQTSLINAIGSFVFNVIGGAMLAFAGPPALPRGAPRFQPRP